MDYIEMGKLAGYPNEFTEITIVKEYLLKECRKIRTAIHRETENAESKNIPPYLINVFKTKLKERERIIQNLLDFANEEYGRIKKENNIA